MGEAKVEKRNRPPKSCEPCRVRKLKCNRLQPCDTCLRRGKESACQYAPNADRAERRQAQKESVTDRLKSLETLISSLAPKIPDSSISPGHSISAEIRHNRQSQHEDVSMGNIVPTEAFSAARVSDIPEPSGIQLHGMQASYVDASHWSSILERIRGIREQLSSSESAEQSSAQEIPTPDTDWTLGDETRTAHDLVFGEAGSQDIRTLLQALPPRHVCDGLVSHYFQSRFSILPILHPTKFQQEYEEFWQGPEATSPVWVGLLFAVLGLGCGFHQASTFGKGVQNHVPSPAALSKRTEQCLVLGRYAGAEAHAVEALMIHVQSCFMRAKDSDVNLWMLMGVVIRLAIRLGYHRDPAKFPTSTLSPFEGEMRRRVWVSIFQIDALMSFQMGLPSMIPSDECDTELPANLEYSDFYPDMAALPPARRSSDYTPILYTIAKQSVVLMFKTVVKHTRSLIPLSYEKTVALDAELRETYQKLPEVMKYKPLRQSVVDSPGLIMNRATIEILYLKSIIVLHRKYITTNRRESLHDASRRACLEAALCVLARQAEAMQPGGRLHEDRWIISALTTNDFILAAMVICLELTIRTQSSETGKGSRLIDSKEDADLATYSTAIQVAREVWIEAIPYSNEARIAAHALDSTIQRVNNYMNRFGSTTYQENAQSSAIDPIGTSQIMFPDLDGMDLIDWGPLDKNFQDSFGEDIDLNTWILDAAASGPLGLL